MDDLGSAASCRWLSQTAIVAIIHSFNDLSILVNVPQVAGGSTPEAQSSDTSIERGIGNDLFHSR